MTRAWILACLLAALAPLAAAAVVVAIVRLLRRRRDTRARDAAAVWAREFDARGGSHVTHAGYDEAQQVAALQRDRLAFRRKFKKPSAPATRRADVVSIASRKAGR